MTFATRKDHSTHFHTMFLELDQNCMPSANDNRFKMLQNNTMTKNTIVRRLGIKGPKITGWRKKMAPRQDRKGHPTHFCTMFLELDRNCMPFANDYH